MKKIYMNPEIKVVKIEYQQILANSLPTEDYNPSKPVDSRELDFDDEDFDF